MELFCFVLFQREKVSNWEGIVMGVEPTALTEPLEAHILLQIQSRLTCWPLDAGGGGRRGRED